MTMKYPVLGGSTFELYLGDVAAAAAAIDAPLGTITPAPADWTPYGSARFPQDMVVDNQDARQPIMTARGRGMPDGERRTLRGCMVTGAIWDNTQEVYADTWGNPIDETASATNQVGIKKQELDLDLQVEEHAVLFIMTSVYGEGSDKWLGLIYLPRATVMLGAMNTNPTITPTPFTISQQFHATKGYREEVFADAT